MATTTTPVRVTPQDVPDDLAAVSEYGSEQLRQGLEEAFMNGAIPTLDDALRQVENHPAADAFEVQVIEAASAEVVAQCAELMRDAIRRRLPWTWEEDR